MIAAALLVPRPEQEQPAEIPGVFEPRLPPPAQPRAGGRTGPPGAPPPGIAPSSGSDVGSGPFPAGRN